MKVGIGSKNLAKIQAVETTFQELGINAEFLPIAAPSGVSAMPFSDDETITGAKNRAEYCLEVNEELDIGIGLEGGVTETSFGLCLVNWGALSVREKETIIAGGARIILPDKISERLRMGEELGIVIEDYSTKQNIRHHDGAIGIFTNGLIKRDAMFSHIIKILVGQYWYTYKHPKEGKIKNNKV